MTEELALAGRPDWASHEAGVLSASGGLVAHRPSPAQQHPPHFLPCSLLPDPTLHLVEPLLRDSQ